MSIPGIRESLGWYAIDWIQNFLVHGPGDVQGEKIVLDDEFAEFVIKAYEITTDGYRKVRRAFLSRPKGRSKSELAAMLACFEALGECRFDHWAQQGEISDWGYRYAKGEPVGKMLKYVEILNVATEENQAGNTYGGVRYMLHPDTCSPLLSDRFGPIDAGLTRTFLPDKRGRIEPVSASNEAKDGAKSTFIVVDESHLMTPPISGVFKLGRMHQTMARNLLKRKEAGGWMLETSTMYAKGEQSVAEGSHAYAEKLRREGNSSSAFLFDHRQADEHWDLTDREQRLGALREAYGDAAGWMNLEGIADYWDDPQASENEFRRFWLNQPVRLKELPVFDPIKWLALENVDIEPPKQVALSIAVSTVREVASIAVAGDVAGRTLVMTYSGRGISWVAAKVAELIAAKNVADVSVCTGEARSLLPDLTRQEIEFTKLTEPDMAASCGAFQSAVVSGMIVHVGQNELDASVRSAHVRRCGKSYTWTDDTGPELVSAAAAAYRFGLVETAPMPAIFYYKRKDKMGV
jgi:hypothetical protein